MADKVMEVLNYIQPILLIVVPTVWVGYQKIKNKVEEETQLFKETTHKKNLELYNVYQHEQSKDTIRRVQTICNLFKDKSKADQVLYLQLENGTIATSKLCNMFVTCLAEDDRYSQIQKKIHSLQRIPFSTIISFVPEDVSKVLEFNDISGKYNEDSKSIFKGVSSALGTGVFDKEGLLIGVVLFHYSEVNYEGADKKVQIQHLTGFKSSIESIFINYTLNCLSKKQELGLEDEV